MGACAPAGGGAGRDGLGGVELPESPMTEAEITAPEAILAMAEEFDGGGEVFGGHAVEMAVGGEEAVAARRLLSAGGP